MTVVSCRWPCRSQRLRRVSLAVVASFPTVAAAQLRVVTWNTLDGPTSSAAADFRTVFGAIRTSAVNGIGIAKRPDVVAVQEQSSTSTANLAAMLNSLYGAGS